jgi:hypothetical protein
MLEVFRRAEGLAERSVSVEADLRSLVWHQTQAAEKFMIGNADEVFVLAARRLRAKVAALVGKTVAGDEDGVTTWELERFVQAMRLLAQAVGLPEPRRTRLPNDDDEPWFMEAAPSGGFRYLFAEANPNSRPGMVFSDRLLFDEPEKLAKRVGDDGRLRE